MKAKLFLLLAALSALATQADAQAIVPKQVQIDDFASCLLRQAPRDSVKLLHSQLDSQEERSEAQMLAVGHSACIHGRVLSARTGQIRGGLAQAFLLRDPGLLDALAARPASAIVRPPFADGRAFVIEYAQCLVGARPAQTAAFLRTAFHSETERTAFLAYDGALSACMPFGAQYDVNIPDVRNQIAAISYLAVAAAPAK